MNLEQQTAIVAMRTQAIIDTTRGIKMNRTVERVIWCTLIIGFVACANIAPEKDFISTLYSVDWESRCLYYVDSNTNQNTVRCFSHYEQDSEGKWHAVDNNGHWMEDVIGISVNDYRKETGFQDYLKVQCKSWKTAK